jgi:hypothetical protein
LRKSRGELSVRLSRLRNINFANPSVSYAKKARLRVFLSPQTITSLGAIKPTISPARETKKIMVNKVSMSNSKSFPDPDV